MCRSIKKLRFPDRTIATDQEIHEAALQYVRKVSGYRTPSAANAVVFDKAVEDVARATAEVLASLRPGARSEPTPQTSG